MTTAAHPPIGSGRRPRRKPEARQRDADPAAQPFAFEMLRIGSQTLRVGRQTGSGGGVPLLMFNGIGANIELMAPIANWMPRREVITFDIPGVGQSPLPAMPYRLPGITALAAGVLDHYGHAQADVLGVSWGGAAAQEFAHSQGPRCRRLILCATAAGAFMVPAQPSVLLKMATPYRYVSKRYARAISGDIYGGDFRRDPALVARYFGQIKWQSRLGYYLQIAAGMGWASVHWLQCLKQPTLVMAGEDDPLVPIANAHLLNRLIPGSELRTFDCGHLFLMTRPHESADAIREFLDRA